MDKGKFILQDYYDMLNLHKALLEAKFHQNPDNSCVAGSPIIANIYNELLDILEKCEKSKANWAEWRKIKNQEFYKDRIIKNIIKYEDWGTLEDAEKRQIVYNYFSPFTVTKNDLKEIIDEIDGLYNLI